ncbi:unnamed protein product [Spirodela intermedia]|uniref:GDP-fucose protein O-fucosyltransferase 2 n=1 Tax=Spirodela intermedia TaxID=51605 RepID=A0A7I8IDB5_SPIIN|nr:unnamed protein product [Spirodela intermedia]CAA6655788.1 unnamed protein product [Spirodela intermedia]
MERHSLSSSDDEDDGEALIAQMETKARPPPASPASRFGGSPSCRTRPWLQQEVPHRPLSTAPHPRPILLFNSGSPSRGVSAVSFGPRTENNQMLEGELRALYLLRNQHLGLLRLWNRTTAASTRSSSIVTSPPPPLVTNSNSTNSSQQIHHRSDSLCRHSRHLFRGVQVGIARANQAEPADDLLSSSVVLDVCRKLAKPSGRRTVEWKPKKNRFLFAIFCLHKHMFFAALLGRVLVLPSPKVDYHYERVIDVDHINKCLGEKVVISFEEFSEIMKNQMHIDRFICYMASPPCFVDEEHAKRLKGMGLSLSKLEAAWPEDAKLNQPKKRTVNEVRSRFSCNDKVLAIGDMFYADVEEEWIMQPGGPLAHKCETLIQPSRLIILTAQRFVQTFLGSNYIALHFRRHGFLQFCNIKSESCFFPIPQAAECILRVVEKANSPVIYLSTDAADSETNLLQSLVMSNGKVIPLVKRPDHNSVEAMLDKTICAMSNVFIGSYGSTFTDDIFRLRKDWGSSSACDENLCHGERPNFIADKE